MKSSEPTLPGLEPPKPVRVVRRAVLVTGDRFWTDPVPIRRELEVFLPGSFLIHGDQRGADTLAGEIGVDLGLVVVRVPYLEKLGRAGGPARNGYMLKLLQGLEYMGYEISCIGFHANIESSKGTANMVGLTKKAKVPTRVVEG